jgi:hypothetical protein
MTCGFPYCGGTDCECTRPAVYHDWSQRWGPGNVKTYPNAAARLVNAAQDMREALLLILSTTTDRGAREEAARAIAIADAAARVRP